MKVELAGKRGFCFGVQDAIALAKKTLAAEPPGTVYVLGRLIHNRHTNDQLERAGLKRVSRPDQIPPGSTLVIPSHGIAPEVRDRLAELNLNIVDASCLRVRRLQQAVRRLHEDGYRVVMIGDRKHPEVLAVTGYAPEVIVVDDEDELPQVLPKGGRLGIVSQTTHAPGHVGRMIGAICVYPFREVKVIHTLCHEVQRRRQSALDLCPRVDVMFVLGGLNSANTRQMVHLCRQTGVATYHLESWDQFKTEMISGKNIAGVTGGASTPESVVQEFARGLAAIGEPARRPC